MDGAAVQRWIRERSVRRRAARRVRRVLPVGAMDARTRRIAAAARARRHGDRPLCDWRVAVVSADPASAMAFGGRPGRPSLRVLPSLAFLLAWRHVARLRAGGERALRPSLSSRLDCRGGADAAESVREPRGCALLVRVAIVRDGVARTRRWRRAARHHAGVVAGAKRCRGHVSSSARRTGGAGRPGGSSRDGVLQTDVLVGGPCRSRIRRRSPAEFGGSRRDQGESCGGQRRALVGGGARVSDGMAVLVGQPRCREPIRDSAMGVPWAVGSGGVWNCRPRRDRGNVPHVEIPGESLVERLVRDALRCSWAPSSRSSSS